MLSNYDEDLSTNPFFVELTKNHSDIVRKCSEEPWIICVPRSGTMEPAQFTIEQILDHILVADDQHNYNTLNKKKLLIKNKCIYFTSSNSVEILFEETFYCQNGNNQLKYTVWCIDGPLFLVLHEESATNHLETLADCVDYLWVESLGHEILQEIRKIVDKFTMKIERENLQTQKDYIGNLYSQCLQLVLRNTNLKATSDNIDGIKVAVEAYMQNCLNNRLLFAIGTATCLQDAKFNQAVRNASQVQLDDLNITSDFSEILARSKNLINKINVACTILDKLHCLKAVFKTFTEVQTSYNYRVTSDDILQILVYLILKSQVYNWIANLIYIKEFRFSLLELSDETGYIVASLEAAIEFIKSNYDLKYLHLTSGHSEMCARIQSDDLTAIINKLHNNNNGQSLCHPLCNCNACVQIDDFTSENVLIFAAILNKRKLVDLLLREEVDVNGRDGASRTALHYAAMKGYQDILLLLLNGGKADVNLRDNDGNTALHLAAENGHENCVKAIIYTLVVEDVINVVNNAGESALHLATRNSYLSIVKLLIEHGADVALLNKRKQSAFDFASNYSIAKLFKHSNSVVLTRKDVTTLSGFGVRPKNMEQFKKIDLLLKAVENNDVQLTCFHLGFDSLPQHEREEEEVEKCHPLCTCVKCSSDLEDLEFNKNVGKTKIHINMCDGNGFTALHVAAKFGRTEILRLLLDSGALPTVKSYKTLYTPLHLASMFQRVATLQELLKCGECHVDAQDFKGNTPLYYACLRNDARIVEILLNNGADCTMRDVNGKSVLQESEGRMHYRIFRMMKDSLMNMSVF